MAVHGAGEVIRKLNGIADDARQSVADALSEGATLILQDMQNFTPRDAANPGAHAVDGLTIVQEADGLKVHIGLPTLEITSDYFWFRFLDGGTAGGEVTYRKDGKRHTMNVPARPALHILDRARDGNIDEVERLVREALTEAMR